MVTKIISGGQTGADLAALDFARARGIAHGGFIPCGRRTEAGPLPSTYLLLETATRDYRDRTEKNILAADATLIVCRGRLRGGSRFTRMMAQRHRKPCLCLDLGRLSPDWAAALAKNFLTTHDVRTLNVAGPRASSDPAIYREVTRLLQALWMLLDAEAG